MFPFYENFAVFDYKTDFENYVLGDFWHQPTQSKDHI